MHARRERAIDRTFRLQCTKCEAYRYAELGGDLLERAEAGDDVEILCARCGCDRPHEVVGP